MADFVMAVQKGHSMRVTRVFVQGMGPDGRYDMRNDWNDDMNVTRGTARSRLDMQHGFVRHIVSPCSLLCRDHEAAGSSWPNQTSVSNLNASWCRVRCAIFHRFALSFPAVLNALMPAKVILLLIATTTLTGNQETVGKCSFFVGADTQSAGAERI